MPLHMMAEVDISLKISRAIVAFFAFKTLSTDIPGPSGGWSPLWHPLSGLKKLPYLSLRCRFFPWLRTFLAAENTGLDMADEKMNNLANSALVSGYCGMGEVRRLTLGFTTKRLYYPATRGFHSQMDTRRKKGKEKKTKDAPH